MFNRSEILSNAWAAYRRDDKGGMIRANNFRRNGPFSRAHFAFCLRQSWAAARECTAEAAAQAKGPVATAMEAVNLLDGVKATRVSEIDGELLAMEMSDAPTNWSRHLDLSAERRALFAA